MKLRVGMVLKDDINRVWEITQVGTYWAHLKKTSRGTGVRQRFFTLKRLVKDLERKKWVFLDRR